MASLKGFIDAGKVVLFLPPRVTIDEESIVLRMVVLFLLNNRFIDIIIDASECRYMDSSGIGELLSCHYACQKEGGSLTLNRPTDKIKALLTITRMINVFNCSQINYSNRIRMDISSDDLPALKQAASSAGTEALNLILALSNGRIQILPGRHEGIFRLSVSDDSSSQLVVAAPYVIANLTRSFIRDEIEEFEEIVNSPRSTEYEIQKFLENHPKFLLGHEYQTLYPQVVLEREQGALIPDFLLRPINREFCDIIDLKLPSAPLIVGQNNRKRFSSSISEAVAQLRTYRDYFDDLERREAVKQRYGITAYRPRLAVVVGRASELDAILYKQIQGDLHNIEVITYDDLIQKAKNFLLV